MDWFNFLFVSVTYAQSGPGYTPLAPIGTIVNEQTISAATQSLSAYINSLFTLGIAAAGFLAVIMIIIGGIQYMGSDVVTSKADAKGRIQNAVLGLVLALSTYLILNTINSDFLNTELAVDQQNIAVQDQLGAAIPLAAQQSNAFGNPNAGLLSATGGPGGGAGQPANPITSATWEGSNFVTRYSDGSTNYLYFDEAGQGHLARYDTNYNIIGSPTDVTPRDYNGVGGAPTAYYTSDNSLIGAAGQRLTDSNGVPVGTVAPGFNDYLTAHECSPQSRPGQCAAGAADLFVAYYGTNTGFARGGGDADAQGANLARLSTTEGSSWREYTGPRDQAPNGSIWYVNSDGGQTLDRNGNPTGGSLHGHISDMYRDSNGAVRFGSDYNSASPNGSLGPALDAGRSTIRIFYFTGPGR